jgi:hypothetical protein
MYNLQVAYAGEEGVEMFIKGLFLKALPQVL